MSASSSHWAAVNNFIRSKDIFTDQHATSILCLYTLFYRNDTSPGEQDIFPGRYGPSVGSSHSCRSARCIKDPEDLLSKVAPWVNTEGWLGSDGGGQGFLHSRTAQTMQDHFNHSKHLEALGERPKKAEEVQENTANNQSLRKMKQQEFFFFLS